MFNRNNRAAPPQPSYQQPTGSYSRISQGTSDHYGDHHRRQPANSQYPDPHRRPPANSQGSYHDSPPLEKPDHSRGQSRQGPEGQEIELKAKASPDDIFTYGNIVTVSPDNFPESLFGSKFNVILNDEFVFTAEISTAIEKGRIGISGPQRDWVRISPTDTVRVGKYDSSQDGYLDSLEVEVSFALRKDAKDATDATEAPYEQDELQQCFIEVWEEKKMKSYWLMIHRNSRTNSLRQRNDSLRLT